MDQFAAYCATLPFAAERSIHVGALATAIAILLQCCNVSVVVVVALVVANCYS